MDESQSVLARRGMSAAVLLLCVLMASTGGVPGQDVAVAATSTAGAGSARIFDPAPTPGSVLSPGTHLIAASAEGLVSSDMQFTVDGQPVAGPTTDVDGDLGNTRGISVFLDIGRHTLGVRTEDLGPLRTWDVVVAGVDIQAAGDDANLIAIRMAGSQAGSRPAVLVDPSQPGFGAVGAALAAKIGGVLLPTDQAAAPDATMQAISDIRADSVLLLGDPSVIDEAVAIQLLALGLDVVRLTGADGPAVSAAVVGWLDQLPLEARPAQDPGVVVAPVEPLAQALAGATRAATLSAPLLLVDGGGPTPEVLQIASRAEYLLLGDGLSELALAQIGSLVTDEVVRNRDLFTPPATTDLVIVSPDAAAGAAVMAAQVAGPNTAVAYDIEEGLEHVRRHQPDRITIVGPDSAAESLAPRVRRTAAGTPLAPRTQSLVDARSARPTITFTADLPLSEATVHVELLGLEWPGQTVVTGDQVVWTADPRRRLPEPLEPQRPDTPATIDVTATFTSHQGVTGYVQTRGEVVMHPVASLSREGFVVAGGSSDVVGTGPLRTFSVAIEPETGLALDEVAEEVERILLDPRGWTADGRISLQRIGAPDSARIRVVVATPRTVDARCGAVGLRTGGRVSCWDGYRAMLNLDRWNTGVVPFHSDVPIYRQYLVNHEVGHGLSHGHVFCPSPGMLAPVMVQQTGGLGGCRPNGWPFPSAG